MSDQTPALAAALARVQAELPTLERDRTVTVAQKGGGSYSYSYVTLSRLTEAVLPLLARHGLSWATMPGTGSDGKMCLRYCLMHESGERLTGEFPISGEGGIQMVGGRITYARRYCLAAVVGVAADEDDESRLAGEGAPRVAQRARTDPAAPPAGQATAQRAARAPTPPPLPGETPGDISPAQNRMMYALLRQTGRSDKEAALAYLSRVLGREIESTKDLSTVDAKTVIDALTAETAGIEPKGDDRDPA